MNIAELALKGLAVGENVNIIFEGQEFTNVQMDRAAKKLGNALLKLGVKRGERVIMQMPNCPEIFQAFQAIWKIGAVCVPINFQVGIEETSFIYQDCGATTVITAPEYLEKVKAAKANAPSVKNIIIVSDKTVEGTYSYARLLSENSDELEMVKTADAEIAVLIYTSGTTGKPKGVMLTHYGLYYTAKCAQETINYPMDTVTIAVLPLCHSFGVAMMNIAYMRSKGKTVILRQFNLEQLFSAIDKYKADYMAAVPTMYVYMLQYPDYKKYDLSSVKYYICGSAPLSVETWKQFKEKFGGEIAEGWGLSEAGANACVNPLNGLKKVGSIGIPLKGIEMKIFDENSKEVPQGKEGEIVIRGPMVMKGYWKMPKETAEVIRNGWLYTGDIGYVDPDGYFYITDRKKDIIIKGGENISPRSIEEILHAHPAVAEAAVIGIKDQVYGEEIKAFVAFKPGQTATADEIKEFCKQKLKKFIVPNEIVILPALPKSLVGKILKKELRTL
jgi:Acyl-CoA synthetases (AMP-forming)/AMP-acid ligases II